MQIVGKLGKMLFLVLFFFISTQLVVGQVKLQVAKLDLKKLPKGITYEGKIKNAVRWTDKLGDNIVITTETGIYQNPKFKHESDGSDAELFAYHYLVKKDSAVRTWKVYDYVSDCPVDIVAEYVNNTFQVTDLDNNGTAEVWLMYKIVCHGDVSPCEMKVILYQGQQKFAMRGRNRVDDGVQENNKRHYTGGEYQFDQAFNSAPKPFIEYAKALWNKNILMKW